MLIIISKYCQDVDEPTRALFKRSRVDYALVKGTQRKLLIEALSNCVTAASAYREATKV